MSYFHPLAPTAVRVEKERPQVQMTTGSHNHVAIKPPTNYISGQHPSSSYVRSTSSRTPTPTSYTPVGSEVYVPVLTDPNLANGGNSTLTSASTGVAVVTINRNPSDIVANPGINIV